MSTMILLEINRIVNVDEYNELMQIKFNTIANVD